MAHMSAFEQELVANWGDSDPFGLVYYAREVAWFNEVEHELFRRIGQPVNLMIKNERSAFVMGEINFRFVGPARYGERVRCRLTLLDVRDKTVHWQCDALNIDTGQTICEGTATRVFAEILEDGSLRSRQIPDEIRESLAQFRESRA